MHGKKIIASSITAILYQVCVLILGFVSRSIFISVIGEELLGLSSLYSNLLEFLNLAELGIGVAVQYSLYEPIVNHDHEKVSNILVVAKYIYDRIGWFVMVAGCVCTPFIQFLIKETTYPLWYVRVAFIISVAGIAFSYFMVYKRLYMTANEEIALTNVVDMVMKIVTVFASILSIVIFKNYFLYLGINALYSLLGNIVIGYLFDRKYKEIKIQTKQIDKETLHNLTKDLKQVIPLKLSNYVYNSTDNIIISKVIGLVTVALYSNYMILLNAMMHFEYMFGNIIMTSMGKIIKETEDTEPVFEFYMVFQYLQFVFTNFCTVCFAGLCTPFITLWVGERFVISTFCFVLLTVDFFVHSMYQPAYVVYGATGKFKEDKYITIASAIMNIVISIILVLWIGLPGVIIGTLITDLYIWVVRTWQIIRGYFEKNLMIYTMKMIMYCVITVIGVWISVTVGNFCEIDMPILELIVRFMICATVSSGLVLITTFRSKEFKYCIRFIKKK